MFNNGLLFSENSGSFVSFTSQKYNSMEEINYLRTVRQEEKVFVI